MAVGFCFPHKKCLHLNNCLNKKRKYTLRQRSVSKNLKFHQIIIIERYSHYCQIITDKSEKKISNANCLITPVNLFGEYFFCSAKIIIIKI